MANKNLKFLNQEDIMKLLDVLYEKSISGIPKISESVVQLADDYLKKNDNSLEAARAMVDVQTKKCATSGALAGLAGIVALPVAIPANVGNVLYVQMRMIACTAYLAGYDVNSDQTQSFVYACLAGLAVGDLCKKVGIEIGIKAANNAIVKIPGVVLTKINQAVGFRLLTKFGSTGFINLGTMVPGVGAAIGGGYDYATTKIIGERSIRWFFQGDYSVEDEQAKKKEERKEKRKETLDKMAETTSSVAKTAGKATAKAAEKTIVATAMVSGMVCGLSDEIGKSVSKKVNKIRKSKKDH